jgi:hypothetical protein
MRLSIAAQRRLARIIPWATIALAVLGAALLTYSIFG